jgi:hypothetical protein
MIAPFTTPRSPLASAIRMAAHAESVAQATACPMAKARALAVAAKAREIVAAHGR